MFYTFWLGWIPFVAGVWFLWKSEGKPMARKLQYGFMAVAGLILIALSAFVEPT
jgi:hypothetical protein